VYQHPSMREGWREGGRASRRRKRELTKTLPDTATCGWLAHLRGARQPGCLEWAGIPLTSVHSPRVAQRQERRAYVFVRTVCEGVCSRSWRLFPKLARSFLQALRSDTSAAYSARRWRQSPTRHPFPASPAQGLSNGISLNPIGQDQELACSVDWENRLEWSSLPRGRIGS
jgi:hypothetical protein